MADDQMSERAWQGRRPRLAAVALWCAVGIACGALALTALPVAFGDADASASTEERLDSVFDQTIGDQLQKYGAGGITGRTNIASVRPYTNPSEEVQFRVDAEKGSYWRTGAYDVFTGKQWHRSSDYQPYDMDDPPGESSRTSRTYTVEMETTTNRIPAAWRPINVDSGGRLVTYDTQGGLKTDSLIGPGDEIIVESAPPVDDPAVLRSAGTEYPDAIEQRYTAVPNSVSDRVGQRADTVTADAETSYDAAIAIKRYLRSNKGYSLDVPPPQDDVASELLFELDEAHCAYFATTMATMLRSQNIPTRYAVGYTTGDRIDGEFVVRDANAHAWVEVYFPEIGWVPFDPTPPDDRTNTVANSVENVSNEDLGSIGDVRDRQDQSNDDPSDPGNNDDDPFDPDQGDSDLPDRQGLSIAVGSRPIPGQVVPVSVVDDGEPRKDVTVLFNGEPIGQTDTRGTVTGTVPYATELEITARVPAEVDSQPTRARTTLGLPTTIDLSLDGHPIAGQETAVIATLGGAPVPDARLIRNGSVIATTDEDGIATIKLPDTPETTLTVEARRDAATGSTNVTTVDVSVRVDGEPFVFPTRSATVTATAGDEPLANKRIYLDGQQLATENGTPVRTNENGTATMTVPPTFGSTISVGGTGTATIRPLVNLIGLLSVIVLTGGGLLFGWQQLSPASRNSSLSGALLDRALAMTNGPSSSGGLGRTADAINELLEGVQDRLRSGKSTTRTGAIRTGEDLESPGAVRRAWIRLMTIVPGVTRTHTPRSIADQAIDIGVPRQAVERLLGAFRAAEYGGKSPSADGDIHGVQETVEEFPPGDGEVTER